jgi:hypothetical protein
VKEAEASSLRDDLGDHDDDDLVSVAGSNDCEVIGQRCPEVTEGCLVDIQKDTGVPGAVTAALLPDLLLTEITAANRF